MPTTSPQQSPRKSDEKSDQKVDEVRKQIIDAAARAFMSRGYAATSIDTIADLIQATKGLIYYYFKSKGDLYLAIHLQAMELSLSTVAPIARGSESPSARLRKMIIAHVHLLMENFAMHKVSLEGVSAHLSGSTTPAQRETLSKLIEMRDTYENLYTDVLREGIETGDFRSIDAKITVKLLLGSVNWMTIWFRPERGGGRHGNDRMADEATAFALNGVRRINE